jgi:hypothetical protein
LPVGQGADHELLQKNLYSAVESVFKEHSQEQEWQRALDSQMDIAVKAPAPEQRLQLSDNGAELVIRYPVDLHRAPEIDDKITRALLEAISKNEKVAGSVTGTPKIRPTVKT